MLYPTLKSLHIISMVAWMAGMFYLPRLFVYHADAPRGSPQSETFKVMERRLLKAIINPAMAATWIFGLWLAWETEAYRQGWFHAKFAIVLLLSGLHGIFVRRLREFAEDRNGHSARYYRVINEVPTACLVAIVVLVVFKPF
ncbi:protoporphyrinogen oxidase HemJ [Enterovirga aerilata]|uniref:Protoporphyrinogen IX oxidase n=1 Tax=Enterovirga aerilata TaxID=2730920 RepID=A0A849I8P9_9HYPH|nr:protoporphyrinogen oxidase HemJ [Enterovirga sp. DB1703]NNM73691.1 protoporphyrinogen oxidase HemJ [Enterovirga sp. DB1703]